MKLHYVESENRIAFFEVDDGIKLPCQVNVLNHAGHVIGTLADTVPVYDSMLDALQSVVDAVADEKNALEIAGVNDSLAMRDYFNCRMRSKWSGYVTATGDSDVFSLSIAPRLVENDLFDSEKFTATSFRDDLSFLFDIGTRIAKGEKLGNKWKKAITAFYNGYTGASLHESIKDDFKLDQNTVDKLGTAWVDYTITQVRMEFLRGCFLTTHALKTDKFGVSGRKARFVNVLLSTDTVLEQKKAAQKKA